MEDQYRYTLPAQQTIVPVLSGQGDYLHELTYFVRLGCHNLWMDHEAECEVLLVAARPFQSM